jgi:hypothetical protein
MSSNDVLGYLVLGIALAFTVRIIVISVRYAKNRARELAKVAQGIGFRFVGNDWSNASRSPKFKTPLFQRTRGRFRNVMTGSADRFQTSLFDYAYTMGKSSVTQTVAAFSQERQLPPFELRPEGVLDRIGDAFVHHHVDFDSHPGFSGRYLVQSSEQESTRKLLTPSLLTYIEQLPHEKKWHIEGAGTTLVIYRYGRPVKASDMPSFLDETSMIASTFFASCGLKKPVA